MEIVNWFQNNWESITVVFLALHTFLKASRDAFDKTPLTDDNWFQRMVTAMGKAATYLSIGKRP